MPKLRATPQEARERALMKAIARSEVELGLTSDTAVAAYLGIERSTYAARKKNNFRRTPFEDVVSMGVRLKFTAKEVCAIFGASPEGVVA